MLKNLILRVSLYFKKLRQKVNAQQPHPDVLWREQHCRFKRHKMTKPMLYLSLAKTDNKGKITQPSQRMLNSHCSMCDFQKTWSADF